MTDWNKLKVVDLKAELKKRGLPYTGLKAQLIARLATAENKDDSEDDSESEATVQGDTTKGDATSPDNVSPTQEATILKAELPLVAPLVAPLQIVPGPRVESLSKAIPPPADVDDVSKVDWQMEQPSTDSIEPIIQAPASHHSALPSAEPHEILKDKSKRKRRSQSPPPSGTASVRKRARQEDEIMGGVDNVVPEAKNINAAENFVEEVGQAEGISAVVNQIGYADSAAEVVGKVEMGQAVLSLGHGIELEQEYASEKEDIAMKGATELEREEHKLGEDRMAIDVKPRPTDFIKESPPRPRNSKFKDLFTTQQLGPSMENSASRDSAPDAVEIEPDRVISPAIHPATSALYIRDFMRPLNPAQLKSYLVVLAAVPGREPDPETIIDFYLDPVRTHAFIHFTSISAASRVRSAIHGRIWPDERTRKPLWADFIPAEKAQEWIQEEQANNAGARSFAKKWEVYYQVDDDRNVTALLQRQEVGSFSRPQTARNPLNAALPSPVPPQPRGIEGAPSGPRAQNKERRTATNLSALDKLFKCTAAKPALYWQPVDKSVANKRLDSIDIATSKVTVGTRLNGEIHRYTFEDNVLVDRGPEIFPGIRPPPGHAGPRLPRGGGNAGRGFNGGGRSDRWNSYRPDRRGPRYDRRY